MDIVQIFALFLFMVMAVGILTFFTVIPPIERWYFEYKDKTFYCYNENDSIQFSVPIEWCGGSPNIPHGFDIVTIHGCGSNLNHICMTKYEVK